MKNRNLRLAFTMTYFPLEVHQKIKFRVFFKGALCGIAFLLCSVALKSCWQHNKIMDASYRVQTGHCVAEVNALMGAPNKIYIAEDSLLVFCYATPNLIFISDPKVYFDSDFKVVKVDVAAD